VGFPQPLPKLVGPCRACMRPMLTQPRRGPSRKRSPGPPPTGCAWHGARRLCTYCYKAAWNSINRNGPRTTRRGADVYEDWLELKAQGYTKRQVADRLGMSFAAFDRAIWRQLERQRRVTPP
jgi:hypothetical protein